MRQVRGQVQLCGGIMLGIMQTPSRRLFFLPLLLSLYLSSARGFKFSSYGAVTMTSARLASQARAALSFPNPWPGHESHSASRRGRVPRAWTLSPLSMVLFDMPGGTEVMEYYESTRPRVPGIIGRLFSRVIAPLVAVWMFLLFLSVLVVVPPVRLLEYSGDAWTCRTRNVIAVVRASEPVSDSRVHACMRVCVHKNARLHAHPSLCI